MNIDGDTLQIHIGITLPASTPLRMLANLKTCTQSSQSGQQALHEVFKKAQHHRHIVIRLLPRLWLQPDNVVHEMGSSYVLI